MTYSEIFKAFECCNNGWCDNRCPYYGREDIADCREQSGADLLDFINRQQAEIERYKSAMPCIEYQDNEFCGVLCGFAEDIINRKNAEIERLNKANQSIIKHLKKARKQLKTAKAEVVKEFADRLIGKAKSTKERFLLELLVESVMKEVSG